MNVTLLQLLTAEPGRTDAIIALLQSWHERILGLGRGLQQVRILSERDQPERLTLLGDWSSTAALDESEELRLELAQTLSGLLVYEPAIYRLRPLQRLEQHDGPYTYAGASLTFAPEALAATVEQVAIDEGERLSGQPGFVWTKRLRSCAGPAVVFTCTAWSNREAFLRALEAVMEPVEDRIDLLGCKQVFFSFVPVWQLP